MTPALAFHSVSKRYDTTGRAVLDELTFEVPSGRAIAIVGRSGSGKSTLLNLAAGIDLPTSGTVLSEGRDLARLSERDRTAFRRDHVGLVFQFFHLLPHLSVRENVALPAFIAGTPPGEFEPRVHELLERVGLDDRSDDEVSRLSGGEQQRVAICRALVRRPRIVCADEPTGNLDDDSAAGVMNLLLALVHDEGATLLCATHSAEVAARTDQTWQLHGGRLDPA
jgi:ABC-type lipoprotein export system ATPase subunit